MRITIVYDNDTRRYDLRADWGFACLVEAHGRCILFDAGAEGHILLGNMEKLGIDPASVDTVFISHAHRDHTGGLTDLLSRNNDVKLYVPASWRDHPEAEEVIRVSDPLEIGDGIRSTGELAGVEQSLVIRVEGGVAVIVGCSHSGVVNILRAAKAAGEPGALIGGLHRFKRFNALAGLGLICPTHCTRFKAEIKRLYPETWVEGGAGRTIELPDG
jgi:7,8-dihydropterin-6-yl-methyl-4-(beta-D-ribofuranosyl)aminobenzene 5'-phosphate synthase